MIYKSCKCYVTDLINTDDLSQFFQIRLVKKGHRSMLHNWKLFLEMVCHYAFVVHDCR